MRQCDALKFAQDMIEFCLVRLEKFAACGDIEEEVTHEEIGAYGAGYGYLLLDVASFDNERRA